MCERFYHLHGQAKCRRLNWGNWISGHFFPVRISFRNGIAPSALSAGIAENWWHLFLLLRMMWETHESCNTSPKTGLTLIKGKNKSHTNTSQNKREKYKTFYPILCVLQKSSTFFCDPWPYLPITVLSAAPGQQISMDLIRFMLEAENDMYFTCTMSGKVGIIHLIME